LGITCTCTRLAFRLHPRVYCLGQEGKKDRWKGIPMTIDNKEYVVFEADFGKEQSPQEQTKDTLH